MLQSTTELVSLADIQAARERIRSAARVTPLLEVTGPPTPDSRLPGPVTFLVKCENLQPMGAFKIRGAFNMLSQLTPEQRSRGVITYSSGNHGQAVALAARTLGGPAVIVMPTTAPAVKVDGAKSYGAEVIFEGRTSSERRARAEREAAARGLTMVPPFDHAWIVAGQGTAGLEILEQRPDTGTVFVPVGGGGLLAGVAAAVKLSRPAVRVVAVEAEGAAKMKRSIDAGQPVTLDAVATIADGLMPVRPGDLTFAHAQRFVDEFVTVSDAQIAAAVAWLFRHARLVVEPSGAATTAAVLAGLGHADPAAGSMVAVVSGGNVAPDAFARYVTGEASAPPRPR
jgi:threonine dehydratase